MTKKIVLIVFGLIFISKLIVFSQSYRFGFEAGFDIANAQMTGEPDRSLQLYYPMPAFNVNGIFGYKISQSLGVYAEPGFIQKGGKQKSTNGDVRLQLNYIQLPVLAELYIAHKIYFSIGPEFGYMINAKAKSKQHSNDITSLYDKRFELSGLAGINYRILDKLDIGLRYNHGLTYTQKIILVNEFGDQTGVTKDYNQYFQVIVKFRINK